MNIEYILEKYEDLNGKRLAPGDVCEVIVRTSRGDVGVDYALLVGLRSQCGDEELLWSERVDFGQTDATVAGGSAFREMAREFERLAREIWEATR